VFENREKAVLPRKTDSLSLQPLPSNHQAARKSVGDQQLRGDTLPYTGIISSTLSTESLSLVVDRVVPTLINKKRKPEGLKSSLKTERKKSFQGRLTLYHFNLYTQTIRPHANLLGTNNCGGTHFHTLVFSLVP
jgi:hypothetical protein